MDWEKKLIAIKYICRWVMSNEIHIIEQEFYQLPLLNFPQWKVFYFSWIYSFFVDQLYDTIRWTDRIKCKRYMGGKEKGEKSLIPVYNIGYNNLGHTWNKKGENQSTVHNHL